MSYASALARYNEICHRVGITPAGANVLKPGFDVALQSAQSRFNNGPARLTTASPSSDGGYTAAAGASAAPMSRTSHGKASAGLTPELSLAFERAAQKHDVPAALLKAVARAESGFRADAVSPAGAQGLMQLMPATGRGLGVTDPFDAEQSINGGARYLHNALEMFDGDVKLALAAYNAGPNAVKKHGGIPPYPETQNYVRKVMDYARQFGLVSLG